MNHKNGRPITSEALKTIEHYSTIDADFVQRTIKTYEDKIGIKLQEVLDVYGATNQRKAGRQRRG